MNNKVYEAKIKWISKENGGRNCGVPFQKNNYAPQISIDGNNVFNGNSWSLLCYSYEYIDCLTTKSYVRFLNANDAPDILYIGTEFELFEGPKKVADGVILNECDYKFK